MAIFYGCFTYFGNIDGTEVKQGPTVISTGISKTVAYYEQGGADPDPPMQIRSRHSNAEGRESPEKCCFWTRTSPPWGLGGTSYLRRHIPPPIQVWSKSAR
eukprot:EG_transcript_44714